MIYLFCYGCVGMHACQCTGTCTCHCVGTISFPSAHACQCVGACTCLHAWQCAGMCTHASVHSVHAGCMSMQRPLCRHACHQAMLEVCGALCRFCASTGAHWCMQTGVRACIHNRCMVSHAHHSVLTHVPQCVGGHTSIGQCEFSYITFFQTTLTHLEASFL